LIVKLQELLFHFSAASRLKERWSEDGEISASAASKNSIKRGIYLNHRKSRGEEEEYCLDAISTRGSCEWKV
jgi:hypothetical protein